MVTVKFEVVVGVCLFPENIERKTSIIASLDLEVEVGQLSVGFNFYCKFNAFVN